MITITVNGKELSVPTNTTLSELINELNVSPTHKLIELRNTIYKQEDFNTITIQENDTLEIIQFMGGGQN